MIDLHTHILPGVDDGARSPAESRALALEAAGEGVSVLAATPHVRADFPTTAEMMEKAVTELRADFAEQGIPVEVLHGGEIDLGVLWAIPHDELRRLTLAQTGRYLLLEFPYRGWPLALDSAVPQLVELGITPLLAHPERNPEVQDRPDRLGDLVAAGAIVQVTSASLDGRLDRASQAAGVRRVSSPGHPGREMSASGKTVPGRAGEPERRAGGRESPGGAVRGARSPGDSRPPARQVLE